MEADCHLLLPEDVQLLKVGYLSQSQRKLLDADPDDYVITRQLSRTHSKIIDSTSARLLGYFRNDGSSITDAVIRHSESEGLDPEETLVSAYPLLGKLVATNLLVSRDSQYAQPIVNSLQPNESWAGYRITSVVRVLEDTEIYKAISREGAVVALKIARDASVPFRLFQREAEILKHIDGMGAPQCVEVGREGERSFLSTIWHEGEECSKIAAIFRSLQPSERYTYLKSLAYEILEAYSKLHGLGVLHGDVHPGNLLFGDDSGITLVDFGSATIPDSDDPLVKTTNRAGFGYYYEPEFARCYLEDPRSVPQASFEGEQHIIAHMLFKLISGKSFDDFPLDRTAGMQYLAASKIRSFSDLGVPSWSAMETVLRKAMSRHQGDRFRDVHEFQAALRDVDIPRFTTIRPAHEFGSVENDNPYVSDFLERCDPQKLLYSTGLPERPYSSINFGSSGLAYFLYRYSLASNSPRHLSWARLWIEKSIAEISSLGEAAFTKPDSQISRDAIGYNSPYHTETGIYLASALICSAMADNHGTKKSISDFLMHAECPGRNMDLTLGNSGVLLACCILLDAHPGHDGILRVGNLLYSHISDWIRSLQPISKSMELTYTGIAHGWSGILYALLLWCKLSRRKVPGFLHARLAELAELATPTLQGIKWPSRINVEDPVHRYANILSWCNGAAGQIYLWTLASEHLSESHYTALATGSATNIIASQDNLNQICCGRSGQAYAILRLYRHTGEKQWLDHARHMMATVNSDADIPAPTANPHLYYSLYKGPLGGALLSVELDNPLYARMPLFEPES